MTANTTKRSVAASLLLIIAAYPLATSAGSTLNCDQIAKDVRESVTKEPGKVLMIVEDALVINESCACEIIKAAIQASNADAAMSKQIVQTAIAVAPKMTGIIVECAEAVSPGAGGGAQVMKSGKSAKSVEPLGGPVAEPKDDISPRADIRGIYLMQPAVGGIINTEETPEEESTDDDDDSPPRKPRAPRKHNTTPVSPSCACPA